MSKRIKASYDDGITEIELNDDPERVVRFNPTDVNFVDRFARFVAYINNDLRKRVEAIASSDLVDGMPKESEIGNIEAMGQELCAELDKAFGMPVSRPAFMGANPLSPTSSGSFLFDNFLNIMMPLIEQAADDHKAARDKYTAPFKSSE